MKTLVNGALSALVPLRRLAACACLAFLALSCQPPVEPGPEAPDTVAPATGSLILRATGARSQSVSLAWDAASDDGTAADALEYALYSTTGGDFSSLDGIKAGTPVLAWTRARLAATATGLSPETSYSFGLVVRDESGNEAAYAALATSTGKGFEPLPSLVGPESASPAPGSLAGYGGKLWTAYVEGPMAERHVVLRSLDGPSWTASETHSSRDVFNCDPLMVAADDALYAFWRNDNWHYIAGMRRDASSGWMDYNFPALSTNAYEFDAAAFGGRLYLGYISKTDTGDHYRVRVAKASIISLEEIAGSGAEPGLEASEYPRPRHMRLAAIGGYLYASWAESTTLRVKRWDGSAWTSVDGGGISGYDVDYSDSRPMLGSLGEAPSLSWIEGNSVKLRVYKDGVAWADVAAGDSAAGYSIMPWSLDVQAFRGRLYLSWIEYSPAYEYRVRLRSFDGQDTRDIAYAANLLDSGPASGIACDQTELSVFEDRLYLMWNFNSVYAARLEE